MASARDMSMSLNIVMNSMIRGSGFLQTSFKGIHKYAKQVEKIDLLRNTKFPLLKRNLLSLESHLGKIRTASAKISANPIRLDVVSSRNSLKSVRKDITALKYDAQAYRNYTKLASQDLSRGAVARRGLSSHLGGIKSVATGVATIGVIGAVSQAEPLRKAIDFETSMADVTKATNADKGQTKALKSSILQMVNKGSLLTPSEIAQIQAGGGRSGVAIKNLPTFTKDIAMASVALDLNTDEAGTKFAKLSERLDLPINKISIMTNAFTHLENNTANSARDMIDTTGRLAGVYKSLNFKPKNAAAISNYMNTLEVSPELAATSFKILTNRLQKTNSELHYYDRLKEKGAVGLKGIIKDITHKMSNEMIMKKFGSQGYNIIMKMSKDFGNLDKNLKLVKDDKFLTAVENEYKVKMATTGAKEKVGLNRINASSILFGDNFKKPYIEALNFIADGINSSVKFYQANKEVIKSVGLIGLKIAGIGLGLKTLSFIGSPIISLVTGVSALSMPLLAITGIATAGYLIWQDYGNGLVFVKGAVKGAKEGLDDILRVGRSVGSVFVTAKNEIVTFAHDLGILENKKIDLLSSSNGQTFGKYAVYAGGIYATIKAIGFLKKGIFGTGVASQKACNNLNCIGPTTLKNTNIAKGALGGLLKNISKLSLFLRANPLVIGVTLAGAGVAYLNKQTFKEVNSKRLVGLNETELVKREKYLKNRLKSMKDGGLWEKFVHGSADKYKIAQTEKLLKRTQHLLSMEKAKKTPANIISPTSLLKKPTIKDNVKLLNPTMKSLAVDGVGQKLPLKSPSKVYEETKQKVEIERKQHQSFNNSSATVHQKVTVNVYANENGELDYEHLQTMFPRFLKNYMDDEKDLTHKDVA